MENIKVQFLGKEKIMVSEKDNKIVKFYGITPITEKNNTVNHHILLVDVSGSMYANIDEMKERLKITLQALLIDDNNYVSVILYSGHNETYRILNAVKCDDLSYKMAKVYETLEKELYVRGVTVMSEPLESAIDIIKDLSDVCDKHHISLFTDGCLVPWDWSTKVEEDKCIQIAKVCNQNNTFLNAIGFGRYYDRKFLNKLIETAGTGKVMHIDEIKEYSETILETIRLINESEMIKVKIENSNFFVPGLNKEFHKPSTINSFKKNEENIIAIIEEDLKIDGNTFNSEDKKVDETIKFNMLYSLALNHIINEDIDSAEVVLAQTGDIAAFEVISNCYSFAEKGTAINKLNRLVVDKDERFKKGKKEIKVLSIEEEPICLLEVLQEILNDKESELLWDLSYKYKRITQKTSSIEDEFKFIYPKDKFAKINSITIGSKKLNIGVNVEINGYVENTNNKLKLDAKIYKDYNLVVNGNINTSEIWAKLSDKLFCKLHSEGLIKSTTLVEGSAVYTIDLTKIKSTNKRMLKSIDQETLATYLNRIEELSVHQWAIKQNIKNILNDIDTDKLEFSNLSEEEIEVRRMFRVDEKGVYKPLSIDKTETEAFEVYPVTILEWKVEKFPKTKLQKELLSYYSEFITSNAKESYDILNNALKDIQREKRDLSNKVSLIRLSVGLIGKSIFLWEEEVSKSKKETDKVMNRNMVIGETMTVSTKTINGISIRQDRYNCLVKCN